MAHPALTPPPYRLPEFAELARIAATASKRTYRQKDQGITKQQAALQSLFRGQGMEFDTVRIYEAGDEVRYMDWRVTARTGKPHTKLFTEDRHKRVLFLVDASPSMFFGTREDFKNVRAARLVARLGGMASAAGEEVGGALLTPRSCQFVPPSSRRYTLQRLLKLLATSPEELISTKSSPWTSNDSTLGQVLRQLPMGRSDITIFSDFSPFFFPSEEAQLRPWRQMAQHHRVSFVLMDDAGDTHLPDHARLMLVNRQGGSLPVKEQQALEERMQQAWQQQRQHVEQFARRYNVTLVPSDKGNIL